MRALKSVAPAVRVAATSENDINSQVANVMARYPELSAYGFHFGAPGDWDDLGRYKTERAQMLTADFVDQVTTCIEALVAPRTRRYAWKLDRHSSYCLKHMVEQWVWEGKHDLASYVSNGAFIVAAVIDGWVPVRLEHSPNCGFRRSANI